MSAKRDPFRRTPRAKPPERVYITFDLVGGIMFVGPSKKRARDDARHYGSTWGGPYILTNKKEGNAWDA